MEEQDYIEVAVTKLYEIGEGQSEITALFYGTKRKIDFLAMILKAIDTNLSIELALEISNEIVDEVFILPAIEQENRTIAQANSQLDRVINRFNQVKIGEFEYVRIYTSAQKIINSYINIPRERLRAKSDDKVVQAIAKHIRNWRPPQGQPEICWVPLFENWTPEQRLTWASEIIARERTKFEEIIQPLGARDFTINKSHDGLKIKVKEKQDNLLEQPDSSPLDFQIRYSPGKEYGPNLYFVYHPFTHFPDYQVWMVANEEFSLYYLNERSCLLEAFRVGVLKALGGVILGWIVASLYPLALFTITGLLTLPPVLASIQSAGHTIVGWVLTKPLEATAVTGQVLSLILVGEHVPPVLPTDEILFVGSITTKKGARLFKRFIASILESKGTILKIVVKEVVIISEKEARQFSQAGRSLVFQVTSSLIAQHFSTPVLSTEAINWLNSLPKKTGLRLMKKLIRSGNKTLITAANTFYNNKGFDRVLSEALSNSKLKREGAEFAVRIALEEFEIGLKQFKNTEQLLKWGISFENYEPLGRVSRRVIRAGVPSYELAGGIKRWLDMRLFEKIYEFKNVQEVSGKIVLGDNEMGQLVKDMIKFLGRGESKYERLKNLRYVFNKAKIGLDEKEIFERLWMYVETKSVLKSYPKSELEAMKQALKDLVISR
jgi:hypothetical protein